MNGIDYFERGWSAGRDTVCLIDGVTREQMTYDEVRALTFRIGNALKGRGYNTGGHGAILALNEIGAFVTYLSLFRLGMAPITINSRNSVEENASLLDAMDCEILFYTSAFEQAMDTVRRFAPRIKEYVCIDSAAGSAPSLDQWIDGYGADEFEIPHDPNRLLLIQPTGGTTGRPKGVMVAHRGMETHVANMMAMEPCDYRPIYLAAAPLTHAAGYLMQTVLSQNGTGILLSKPDKQLILSLVEEFRVTHTFLPPTLIYELLDHPDIGKFDYSSMRCFLYGASPMAPEKVKRAIEVFGASMCQAYGQAEASYPNTFLSTKDHVEAVRHAPARLASCGRATPFCMVAIMKDGQLQPDGEIGELVIRTTGIMLGYYKDAQATAEVAQNGWHLTGDVGYRDADGFFYIVDRKKDMIITGGFNVFSIEVETVLLSHPAVQNCAVVGAPDPKWGERILAEVELAQGASITEAELIAYCKEKIGSLKAPKQIVIANELPRSAVGKILKREVRAKYWADKTRMVN
ncbi:class I adenylate-forming enzyme family protein [Aliihoeflea sp. 2WW]|uniref:class I adenylate-forming enzyme family protein n=1 Tax=Aliihoeflea sp. 2WW TaxID=1381123 RepID=UPI0004646AF6|nr:AMP-binding protein [Aliihoeflea sp. 2WW]